MSDLGPYTLLRRLAVGGMAEIFLARREGPGGFAKIVALKKILPHLSSIKDFVDMFLDEARIAARLSHPNIVQIYDFGTFEDSYFIAMEYVPGEDLLSVIRQARDRGRPVPPVMAATILASACEALHYAHDLTDEQGRPLGIVHRDVTPSNLLVSFDGIVKLADFGIAKAEHKVSHTVAGALKGKYAYMSPEQVLSKPVDRRSDVFSVGVVAYELLTGQRLFHRDGELAILAAITKDPIPHPRQKRPDLPDDLDAIVMRALDRNPSERWKTAQQMQLALEEFCILHASAGARFQLAQYVRDLFGAQQVVMRQKLAAGDLDEGEENTAMVPPPVAPAESSPSARTPELAVLAAAQTVVDEGGPVEAPSPEPLLTGQSAPRELPGRRGSGRRTWMVAGVLGLSAAASVVWYLNQEGAQSGEVTPAPAEPASMQAPAPAIRQPDAAPIAEAPEPDATPAPAMVEQPVEKVDRRKERDREKERERDRKKKERERDKEREKEKEKEEAFLTIDMNPWAEVILDGKSIGTTPIAKAKIEPGKHTLVAIGRDEGYRLKWTFVVKPGEEHVEKRVLSKGKLACDADPWAEVFIGKRRLGTTPLAPISLTEGTYTLRLVNPELKKQKSVTARVKAGEVTVLKEKL